MNSADLLLSKLHQADLLPTQQKLVQKLEAKPFELSKKSTYEPLYDLLKTLFITEYPNFQISSEIAQIFFDHDVENVHSSYRDFQSYGMMFHSFFSTDDIKKDVYIKITKDVNPVILEKRIARCNEETLLIKQVDSYKKLSNSLKADEVYRNGFAVIIAALQILEYLPEEKEQSDRMNQLIDEVAKRLKQILPNVKTI